MFILNKNAKTYWIFLWHISWTKTHGCYGYLLITCIIWWNNLSFAVIYRYVISRRVSNNFQQNPCITVFVSLMINTINKIVYGTGALLNINSLKVISCVIVYVFNQNWHIKTMLCINKGDKSPDNIYFLNTSSVVISLRNNETIYCNS
jgi:hypothetical protein